MALCCVSLPEWKKKSLEPIPTSHYAASSSPVVEAESAPANHQLLPISIFNHPELARDPRETFHSSS